MSKPRILFARDGDAVDLSGPCVVEVHTRDPEHTVCLVVTEPEPKPVLDAKLADTAIVPASAMVRRELVGAVEREAQS